MERVRAFIAIELPPKFHEVLGEMQEGLRQRGKGGIKWVKPENIHLTLKFLGEVPASLLEGIKEATKKAAGEAFPFALELGAAGVFPSWSRPRVIWVGLAGDIKVLASLQGRLDKLLEPLGFPGEAREFVAHLTLGRVREGLPREELQRLGEAVASLKMEESERFDASHLTLFKSQLTPQGPIYTPLASFPLARATP